jgi:hypothetical protein
MSRPSILKRMLKLNDDNDKLPQLPIVFTPPGFSELKDGMPDCERVIVIADPKLYGTIHETIQNEISNGESRSKVVGVRRPGTSDPA